MIRNCSLLIKALRNLLLRKRCLLRLLVTAKRLLLVTSKCLTQEFSVTKDEDKVGAGTPSTGNSVGELDNDDDPDEFDYAHDDEGYDEDDLMADRQSLADLNSFASDHVDIDALLTQRRIE
jgi:hypothetical protein